MANLAKKLTAAEMHDHQLAEEQNRIRRMNDAADQLRAEAQLEVGGGTAEFDPTLRDHEAEAREAAVERRRNADTLNALASKTLEPGEEEAAQVPGSLTSRAHSARPWTASARPSPRTRTSSRMPLANGVAGRSLCAGRATSATSAGTAIGRSCRPRRTWPVSANSWSGGSAASMAPRSTTSRSRTRCSTARIWPTARDVDRLHGGRVQHPYRGDRHGVEADGRGDPWQGEDASRQGRQRLHRSLGQEEVALSGDTGTRGWPKGWLRVFFCAGRR